MRVLFYCHHSLGIGHYARTLKLAVALDIKHRVAIISGGLIPHGLKTPPGVVVKTIPAISMGRDGALRPEDPATTLAQTFAARRKEIISFATSFDADVLVVEMFPFGRRKFSAEIIELMQLTKRKPGAVNICSVRDVLVSRQDKREKYEAQVAQWLNEHIDAVLTHGDEQFISLRETFTQFSSIQVPVHHTGYVCTAQVADHRRQVEPTIIVSSGGGRVGNRLLDVVCQAAGELKRTTGLDTVILRSQAQGHNVDDPAATYRTRPFEPELAKLLARSALSISQCGYNTATDVLAARIPAVFVPFESASEDEQLYRAKRFEEHRRAGLLREADLTTESLVYCATKALQLRTEQIASLDGAASTLR